MLPYQSPVIRDPRYLATLKADRRRQEAAPMTALQQLRQILAGLLTSETYSVAELAAHLDHAIDTLSEEQVEQRVQLRQALLRRPLERREVEFHLPSKPNGLEPASTVLGIARPK